MGWQDLLAGRHLVLVRMGGHHGGTGHRLAAQQLSILEYKVRRAYGRGGNGPGDLLGLGAALQCVLQGDPVLGGSALRLELDHGVKGAAGGHGAIHWRCDVVRVGYDVLELPIVKHAHVHVLDGADLGVPGRKGKKTEGFEWGNH